jgi:hypothetical protein
MADVRRGIWQARITVAVEEPRECPSFHVFATEWLAKQIAEGGRQGKGLATKSRGPLVAAIEPFARRVRI